MSQIWCRICGIHAALPGEDKCEDCWVDGQVRYNGHSRSVYTMVESNKAVQDAKPSTQTRRSDRI